MYSLNTNNILPKYIVTYVFILAMVAVAYFAKDREIVLPEIAAMAIALWVWQDEAWLRQPDKIFILPSYTAAIGFAINMLHIPYLSKLMLVLIGMLVVMILFKYSFPPALATGFLPIVTNAYEWSFMIAILITTFILMLGVILFKLNKDIKREVEFNRKGLFIYFTITTIWMSIAWAFKIEQMALIPPITVVIYESINMKMYTLKMAIKQVAILTISITFAVLLSNYIENWLILSILFLLMMNLLLKLFRMKIPAVYAFPFLIFVFPPEKVSGLPIASLAVSVVCFTMVYLYHKYIKSKIKLV